MATSIERVTLRRKSLLLCVTTACEVIERNVNALKKKETEKPGEDVHLSPDGRRKQSVEELKRLRNTAEATIERGSAHAGWEEPRRRVTLRTDGFEGAGVGDREGLSPFLGSREHLRWFTLVFVPGRRCYRTLGGPLHYNELIGVVVRPVMQQEFLNCPLFNLQGQRGGN